MPEPESNGAWRYYILGDGTADLYVYLDADATEVEIPAARRMPTLTPRAFESVRERSSMIC